MKVGDPAPDFSLPSTGGRRVSLSEFRGRKRVVLYFYIKDGTPGCTKEACSFRDSYRLFEELGAEVIGVSLDGMESHQRFAQGHSLPFTLLSDRSKGAARAYGAAGFFGALPRRVSFVIDEQGVVRHKCSSMSPAKHAREALEALRLLRLSEAGA